MWKTIVVCWFLCVARLLIVRQEFFNVDIFFDVVAISAKLETNPRVATVWPYGSAFVQFTTVAA